LKQVYNMMHGQKNIKLYLMFLKYVNKFHYVTCK